MDTRNMLFRKEERTAVEDRFLDDSLYDALAGATRRVMQQADAFRLHPSELFYHAFLTLDWLKGQTAERQQTHCQEELWAELDDYLRQEKAVEASDHDIRLTICTIMQAVAELLVRSRECRYIALAAALKRQIAHHLPSASQVLDREFGRSLSHLDGETLAHDLSGYLSGNRLCSDEIDLLLDGLDAATSAKAATAGSPAPTSPLHIAQGKTTSVLLVLDAMYKAGWFVDDKGQRLTNRNRALNEILRHAFNTSCDHIPQMLRPSNNPNDEKQEELLRSLLGRKE